MKPDHRQIAVDNAAQALKDAGAETYSVLVPWPDGATFTALAFPVGRKSGKALGKGLREIRRESGTGENLAVLGKG